MGVGREKSVSDRLEHKPGSFHLLIGCHFAV
jgi:hypothetical protein